MKIEVSNKKFSGEQNGFNFVKGFAEVKEGDEAKARRIANVLGYKIIEDKAKAKAEKAKAVKSKAVKVESEEK